MTKEEIKNYIKNNLHIEVEKEYSHWGSGMKIKTNLLLEGEEISSDYFRLEDDD